MVGGTVIPNLEGWNLLTLDKKITLIESVATFEELEKLNGYNEKMRNDEQYKTDQLTDVSFALLNKARDSFPQDIKSTGGVTKKVRCSCTKKGKKQETLKGEGLGEML